MYGKITFYPALFRVIIGILLIIDIVSSLFFQTDLYAIPEYHHQWDDYLIWLTIIRENSQVFLSLYLIVVILWLLGIGKQITSFLVFVGYTIDFFMIFPGLFWGDYILRITLLFFVFVNSFHFFSFKKDKGSTDMMHRLAILSIMLHLCLIYVENAYFKFHNDQWVNGYAIAYFFEFSRVLDIFKIGDIVTKSPILIRIISWSVLLFQITFPLALWIKKLKKWWIIAGVLIHIIMAVTLQLYKFEFIMILLYGFFLTDMEWQCLLDKFKIKFKIIHGER